MVDADDVTHYNRTQYELEEFLLFCIVVAGKRAFIQAQKLDNWLKEFSLKDELPFETIRRLNYHRINNESLLETSLKTHKMGQYSRLVMCFKYLAFSNFDLKTCTTDDLESIHGVGPKTSRFFILHSRKDQRIAVLDTHILSWLRDKGVSAPKTTPSAGKKYAELEKIFLELCDKEGKDPATMDLAIWVNKRKKMELKS